MDERKYEDALKRAKDLLDDMDKGDYFASKADIENIFPELQENKDERIRKTIYGWIYTQPSEFFDNGFSKEEMLAWLEKQREQTHAELGQSEATKTSDQELEPKFHKGEWIIHQGTENIYQVIARIDNQYQLKYGDNYTVQKCADVDRCARLWNITKDAKDGDVLATAAGAFIYNGNNGGGGCPGSYCGINTLGKFQTGFEHHWTSKKVYPATKEQRDLLFQKMKEAGYEWDAQKKELKKIESKKLDMTREEFINWFEERFALTKNDIYEFGQLYDEVTKPQWISVEDELPPKENEYDDLSNNVLATDGKEIYESVYNHDFEDWFTHDMWGLDNITHWMPLPQPPKKGGKE